MEYLPEEMVLLISEYLPAKDLAACCAVSHAWRDIFNMDVFWKSRCDSNLVQNLRGTKCAVEPSFVSPEIAGSELKDVCEWRLNYMRQNHLDNNLRQGKHKTFRLSTDINIIKLSVVDCVSYERDFVVVYGIKEISPEYYQGKIQLWYVRSNPILVSEYSVMTDHRYIKQNCHHFFYVTGNLVVLIFGDFVQVLTITRSLQLQFKHVFHFCQQNKELNVNAFEQDTLDRSIAIVRGLILIGSIGQSNINKKLHVWNVETGEKLREEEPHDPFVFMLRLGCGTGNKIIINSMDLAHPTIKLLMYDLTQLIFYPYIVHLNSIPFKCLLHKECLAVMTREHFKIHNIVTKQVVLSINTAGTVIHPWPFGNDILLDDGQILKLFKPMNSKVQLFFQHPEVDRKHHLISVVRDKFVLLRLIGDDFPYSNDVGLPVQLYFVESNSANVLRPFITLRFGFIRPLCSTALISHNPNPVKELLYFW